MEIKVEPRKLETNCEGCNVNKDVKGKSVGNHRYNSNIDIYISIYIYIYHLYICVTRSTLDQCTVGTRLLIYREFEAGKQLEMCSRIMT